MSRRVVLSLLSVLALVAILALAVWYFVGRYRVNKATLFPQEGVVTVRRGSSVISALAPPQVAEVYEGDEIQTGTDSSALIVLFSGVSAQLGSDSDVLVKRLSFSEDGPSLVELEIRRGDTWFELPSSIDTESQYQIATPSGTVMLSPGRHHVTVSGEGSTRVEVREGAAKVKAQSSEVEVWAGEYTSVASGRAPAFPRPIVARFLFVSERQGNADIWALDEEGRELQLTDDLADDLAPAWSPDGTKIAFETLRDGNSEIYVMNDDGSEQVNLTHNPAPDHVPVWSPDGTRIAFESWRDQGRDIYIMNADGSEQTRLTSGPGLSLGPHWSADGHGIIFTRIEEDTNGDGLIDEADMGVFLYLDSDGGRTSGVRGERMIFDQMILPWARGIVG